MLLSKALLYLTADDANKGHSCTTAAALTFTPPDDPLALSVEDLNRDFQINTASVLEAAKQAVAGFSSLPSAAAKTFIYTGNRLTDGPLPGFVDLGIGKSGSAHLIAAASEAYAPKGFRYVTAECWSGKTKAYIAY